MRKPVNNFTKKKEGDTNVVAYQQPSLATPIQYFPYMAAAQHQQPQGYPLQMPVSPAFQQALRAQQPQQQVRKVFDPIPVSYGDLLPYLIGNKMVTPRTVRPLIAPFPAWYKPDAKCEFHSGAEGHNIDNCRAFKHEVQKLLDQKLLTFKEAGPNVKGNPLPGHSGANVNHVSSAEGLIRDVADIRTPLISVREALLSYDQFSDMHA
jgi:hypothetical protein